MSEAPRLPLNEITAVSPPESASEAQTECPPSPSAPTELGIIPSTPLSLIDRQSNLIDRMMHDPTCDLDRIERAFAFQERLMARQAEIDFNEAMARLHAKLADIRIVRTKSVSYEDKRDSNKKIEAFRYTPLDEIDKVVRPLLNEESMVPTYTTEIREGGGAVVVARLTHKNGHYREASIPLPLDSTGGKSNVQAMGSTFSYGRRYTLCMLLNIVTLDDDDGTGGAIDKGQAKTIRELIISSGADEAKFLQFMHATSVDDIAYRDYRKATGALEGKIAKKGEGK
jgi:hypothetical protein